MIVPCIGGAFGAKNAWYPEFTLCAYMARSLGRPVKYTQSRSEALVAMCHGRDQRQDVVVGYDDEGRILALSVDIVQNCGAYPTSDGLVLPSLTKALSSGAYQIPQISVSTRCVATNTTPVRPYRGAGRPEATFFIERVVDRIAVDIGVDAAEVRSRNFIQPHQFPYRIPSADVTSTYDTGDYDQCLARAQEIVGYKELREEQAARRLDPTAPLLGIGLSTFVEQSGGAPSWVLKNVMNRDTGGWEAATVRLFPDGDAMVLVGTSPQGQGHETIYAQIAAQSLGLSHDQVVVVEGDTTAVAYGVGTFGARSTTVGGSAVWRSAEKIIDQARDIAANMLEIDSADLDFKDGRFTVRGSPEHSIGLPEVAQAAYHAVDLPPGVEAGLNATTYWEPTDFVFPSGAYCCVVEIDRETGKVSIRRMVAVDDVGNVVNPLLAEGQVHGGTAQGIAGALFEEVTYDSDGQPLNGNFLQYLIPSAADLPAIESAFVSTKVTPLNPLGVKGVGESGTIGAPAAVVNAVVDALSHLGITELHMPIGPEQVWRALQIAPGEPCSTGS